MKTKHLLINILLSSLTAFCFAQTSGTSASSASSAATSSAVEAPNVIVERLAKEITQAVKADPTLASGDIAKVTALVNDKVMPQVNFARMTASSVGPAWRSATKEQKEALQTEFKTLLIRTYAGAIRQIKDQTIVIKPLKAAAEDINVIVRSEVRGKGDPIQLDYRVGKLTDASGTAWKIYDINFLGVWLVETYRGQFAQEINANGIDGLIKSLTEKNNSNKK